MSPRKPNEPEGTWLLYTRALAAIEVAHEMVATVLGRQVSMVPAVPVSPALVAEIETEIERFKERLALLVAERKKEARG